MSLSQRAISRVRAAPRITLQGIVEMAGKTLEVRYSQWDTLLHWGLKLACASYLVASNYEPGDITFEKRIGDAKADIYADNGTTRIWVECETEPKYRHSYDLKDFQQKLAKIRQVYDGKLILAVQQQGFSPFESMPEFKSLVENQRQSNGRVNWRLIHKAIPINYGYWFIEATTFPRIVYGIERNGEDEFVFIANWSIGNILHPRKGDKLICILPDGQVRGADSPP